MRWFNAASVFAVGLFVLVAAAFLGTPRIVAIGHFVLGASLVMGLLRDGWGRIEWRTVSASSWCLLAFVVLSTVSVAMNHDAVEFPVDNLKRLRYYVVIIGGILFPVLWSEVIGRRWRRDVLVLAWLSVMVIATVVGIWGWVAGAHPIRGMEVADIERVSGFHSQVIDYACVIQFAVLGLAVFAVRPSLWARMTRLPWWCVVASLVVAGAGLYLTYTRGAVLGALVGLLSYVVVTRKYKLALLIAAVGAALGVVAFVGETRYFSFESSDRVNQWKAAALCFVERPVFGIGFRNFEPHSVEMKQRYGFEGDYPDEAGNPTIYFKGHAHNQYLEAFASTGVFGGLAFLGFCLCWLREAWLCRETAPLFVPVIVAFLVSGVFSNNFFLSASTNAILLIYLFSEMARRQFLVTRPSA